ncbi:unnamed protein product [Jaminaea pallidilutea]
MTAPTPSPLLLVRKPSPKLSSGQLTHLAPSESPLTHEQSLHQWHAYCDVFREHGWQVVELDELDDAPDGVFVEDAMIVFPTLERSPATAGTVVLVRSGSDARRAEYESAKRSAEKMLVPKGYEVLDFHDQSVDPSGGATLDGGDILKVVSGGSGTVFVGQSSRTNRLGIEVLERELGKKRGWNVVSIPVEHHLHLKSATTAIPGEKSLTGHDVPRSDGSTHPGLPLPEDYNFCLVPEEQGIAVVDLTHRGHPAETGTKGTLLLSSAAPKTKERLEQKGYKVVTTDVSDFEKMEGCVTCLSVRVRTPIN